MRAPPYPLPASGTAATRPTRLDGGRVRHHRARGRPKSRVPHEPRGLGAYHGGGWSADGRMYGPIFWRKVLVQGEGALVMGSIFTITRWPVAQSRSSSIGITQNPKVTLVRPSFSTQMRTRT